MKTTGILFAFSFLLMPLFSLATSGPTQALPEPAALPLVESGSKGETKTPPERDAKKAKSARKAPAKKLPTRAQIWLT